MSIDRALSVIDAFLAKPRTVAELVVVCRVTEDTARRYIAELRSRNRLTFDSFAEKGTELRGSAATIWRWVPPEQENG
jgi:DNA-binding IclR family transcriptional regulator